jgi:DNA-binding FrmR family transcriptional regulator
MMNNTQTKVPKTLKQKVWVANQDFEEKRLTCAKGQILPAPWQSNSSLRNWLREHKGKDCIALTDMMMEQKTPNEDVLKQIKAKDNQIKSLEERIVTLESKVEKLSPNKTKSSGRTRGTRR